MPNSLSDHYPSRVVIYVDVLGFACDVFLADEKPGLHLSHSALLRALSSLARENQQQRESLSTRSDARMAYFSDCVVVSLSDELGAATRAMAYAAFIGHMILRRGYLFRGAVTIGALSHEDSFVWGRGLVEAVRMEQKEVTSPRIALSESMHQRVLEEISRGRADKLSYIRNRGDGDFVHVLGDAWPFLAKERSDRAARGIACAYQSADDWGKLDGTGCHELYEELHDVLPLRYDSAPTARARDKIRWMADYVNDVIEEQRLPARVRIVLPND